MQRRPTPIKGGFIRIAPVLAVGVLILLIFFGGRYLILKIKENRQASNQEVELSVDKNGTSGQDNSPSKQNNDADTTSPTTNNNDTNTAMDNTSNFKKEANLLNVNQEKFISGNDSTVEQITVYANSDIGQAKFLIGFLHGITYDPSKNYDKTIELLSALKPSLWRLGYDNNVYVFISKGDFVRKFNTAIMFVIQDAVHGKYGYDIKISPKCPNDKSNCFKSFDDFKNAWATITTGVMKEVVQKNYPIKYFEVFGEPINVGFGELNSGTGISGITPEQLMELYKTSHDIIRSKMPSAKIGGPGWISYSKGLLSGFLDYVVKENLSLDFLSWHEFDTPEDIAIHVAEAKKLIGARPQLCNPNCPEIQITEFSPSEDMHIPATGLAWFYYLEKAGVDGANRACWDVDDPRVKWDTCWAGFNGMFLRDNVATTDMYWVYRMYADMDNTRVRTDITKPHTVAISDRDDSQKELKVLVGRYGYKDAANDVKISVKKYPFSNAKVSARIWKVPANGKLYQVKALQNPIQIESQELNVTNGEITLNIGSFKDGEVYYLIFEPI